MRIAQIAPLWERVPPLGYGGIELIVGLLTDELVRRGHEVTLFASGDSQTLAQLEPICPQALRKLDENTTPHHLHNIYQTLQLNKILEQVNKFDLIHSHIGFPLFPYANLIKIPTVHTIHGIIPSAEETLWHSVKQQNFISISNAQRRHDLELNYVATVYNAINTKIFPVSNPDNPPYLAFLGRLSPEKGPHLAIDIAKQTGLPLKMAGKVDAVDRQFFEEQIKPFIDGKQIQFLGEADHQMKCELMGRAIATLFPITWPEPFGLVMIESMILGTPVIAMEMGSTREVIADGKTGFLCHTVEDCVTAVKQLETISRQDCRDHVMNKFSVQHMVDGYESVYQKLLQEKFIEDGQTRHLQHLKTLNLLSA
ncbi:glycosyl transferase group 1 [Gloeothece citriformis PCC 7424]|uniref:Glycosyl transferase group 1 n=1 Tax=Gloeothece citriformis (strain PCC 7424) TaxID=65393 RepID=B7KKW7_GLOC7|nr:glycosyltransferase family 4 protein [Gloeothece citriformis]ACK71086.1 glycosyl transferase group 1 [Gloeothece citriformis PCC 7424]